MVTQYFSVLPKPADDLGDTIYLGNPTGISAYADMQTDAANAYLLRLGDATAGLAPPVISPQFPTGGSAPAISVVPPPTMMEVVWTAPNAPSEFTETLTLDNIMPAPFTEDAPEMFFGTAPADFVGSIPDAPPVDTNWVMPELEMVMPDKPQLLSLNISKFDGLNLPTFDATAPTLDLVAPSIREYVPGAEYTSALLQQLQTSLLERIRDGGTGLNADVENAIWDRGREREARAKRAALDELEKMEALGYSTPPGVYVDARIKIATETDYAERGHSREVISRWWPCWRTLLMT